MTARQRQWNLSRRTIAGVLAVCGGFLPAELFAWGSNAQRLIISHAVDTLPYEMRPFFEANRTFLVQHVNDSLNLIDKNPNERLNHFIALAKYSKSRIDSTGLLPWQIGVYSAKLTEDMRVGRWEEAKIDAAFLANYVAESHDPFNTTENFDGKLTGQSGVNERFNTVLIDRYGSFFPINPHDAFFISDPTDFA